MYLAKNFYELILRPIHRLQQAFQRIKVARVGIHVEDVAVAVDELVGREAVHAKEVLDGGLLLGRQIIVHHIVACHVVFLDDILPRLLIGAVGEVEVYDVVILQMLVFFLAVLQSRLTRAAPRAPDIK